MRNQIIGSVLEGLNERKQVAIVEGVVAETIVKQLGGMNKLRAMLGAKNFVGGDNFVMFSFKGTPKTNKIKITLNGKDLYDVEFFKLRAGNEKLIETFDDVYADKLKGVIEKFTGLYLSLF